MTSTTVGELVERHVADIVAEQIRPYVRPHLRSRSAEGLANTVRKIAEIATSAAIEATGISSLQKEIGAYREALERIADPRNIHFAGDAQALAKMTLAALSNTGGHTK